MISLRLALVAVSVALCGCKPSAPSSTNPAPSASTAAEISPTPAASANLVDSSTAAVALVDAAPTTPSSSAKPPAEKTDAGVTQAQLQMLKALQGGSAVQGALKRTEVPVNELSGAPSQPSATPSPHH